MAKKEMTTDKFEVTNCDLKEGALEQITVHDQLSIDQVKSHIYSIRGTEVMLDRELAQLYGVETKVLNQAVKRNIQRFPERFMFQVSPEEWDSLKSQIVTSNLSKDDEVAIKMGIRRAPYAFTEKGLYMLSTVLKSDRAIQATHAIIETYAQVRAMVRDMEALQTLKDGSVEQASKLTQAGHKLASLIGDNLSTDSTKTTIELNLAVLKITHEVTRSKKEVK